MEETAALEVRLGDLLGRRLARDAEQLVVRQPVDAAVGVLDELGVARRPVRRLRRDLDVQAVETAAAARGPLGAVLLPLDDAAGDERVEDLRHRGARGARDLQERVDVEDPVDPGQQVGLLRRERQVLVTRHRVRGEDRHAMAVAQPLPEDVALGKAADALDDDRRRRKRRAPRRDRGRPATPGTGTRRCPRRRSRRRSPRRAAASRRRAPCARRAPARPGSCRAARGPAWRRCRGPSSGRCR